MTKNRLEGLRSFVGVKAYEQTSLRPVRKPGSPIRAYTGAPKISGPDLEAIRPIVEAMGPDDRRRVLGMFQTFGKYEVLNMMLSDGSPFLKANREAVLDLAESATHADREKAGALATWGTH